MPWENGAHSIATCGNAAIRDLLQTPTLTQGKWQRKGFRSLLVPALRLLLNNESLCWSDVKHSPAAEVIDQGSWDWCTVEAEVLMRSWGRLSRASCIRRRALWKASITQQVTANQTASDSSREGEGWLSLVNIISPGPGASLPISRCHQKPPGPCSPLHLFLALSLLHA